MAGAVSKELPRWDLPGYFRAEFWQTSMLAALSLVEDAGPGYSYPGIQLSGTCDADLCFYNEGSRITDLWR